MAAGYHRRLIWFEFAQSRDFLSQKYRSNTVRKLLPWAPVILFAAFLATYIAGCWTPAPPAPRQPVSLRDQCLNIDPAPQKLETRFAVFGDVKEGSQVMEKIVAEVETDGNYDFAACTGDMVTGATESYYEVFSQCALLNLRKTPLIFIPGNHDVGSEAARTTLYEKHFGAPFYKFSIGKTLFVIIDNATSGAFDGQYKWLETTLKSERAKYDTLIVFMHMPPLDLRGGLMWHAMPRENGDKLLALLKEYNTAAIFCGHIHAYEEWKENGIPTYVTGGGGADLVDPNAKFHFLEVVIRDGKVSVTVHPVAEK
jgi:predicted phosphodiesterase